MHPEEQYAHDLPGFDGAPWGDAPQDSKQALPAETQEGDALTEALDQEKVSQDLAGDEIHSTEDPDCITISVKLSPETIKRMKVLAIVADTDVIATLTQQLEQSVNGVFDRLIQDELRARLASSGVLTDLPPEPAAAPVPRTVTESTHVPQDDAFSHAVSGDEAEPMEEFREESGGTAPASPGFPMGSFPDVGDDTDAHLDAIFGGGDPEPPAPVRRAPPREQAQMAALVGAPGSQSVVTAKKTYGGKMARVSAAGDEELR